MDSDAIHLRIVFPDELWLMIFANTHGVDGYHQICKSSSHLERLIRGKRTTVLFSCVAQLVFQQSNAHPNQSQTAKMLLECRKMCSAWKRGVDLMFQSDYFRKRNQTPNFNKNISDSAHFKKWGDFQKFNKHFKPTHFEAKRNPFPFRSVKIEVDAIKHPDKISDCLGFLDELSTTFSIYGNHVWFFSVQYTGEAEKLEVCRTMRRVLEHLPNLKQLKISYNVNDSKCPEISISDICGNRMPNLKNLELLECNGVLPLKIIVSILDGTTDQSGLSKLSHLQMNMNEMEPLDFLLPLCNSLKWLFLNVTRTNQEHRKCEGEIKFYKYLGQLQESNIWDVFLNLQEIKFYYRNVGAAATRREVCTREEWKKYKVMKRAHAVSSTSYIN